MNDNHHVFQQIVKKAVWTELPEYKLFTKPCLMS
jgi:hypothetical protein